MDVETFRAKVLVIMSESIGHPLHIGHAARRITELYAGIAASEPCAYHERELLRLKAKVARVEALAEQMHADARDLWREGLRTEANCTLLDANAIRAALADPEEATMPKPEPKPVVTLSYSTALKVDGRQIGHVLEPSRVYLTGSANVAELRAIADWLDQWQDATLLSEVKVIDG